MHGPFDTDFYIRSDPFRALIEYDGLTLTFENGVWKQQKSVSVVSASQSYLSAWSLPTSHKVSRGASWLDRLLKMQEFVIYADPRMSQLFENLRTLN